jgi:hypothetical protein
MSMKNLCWMDICKYIVNQTILFWLGVNCIDTRSVGFSGHRATLQVCHGSTL